MEPNRHQLLEQALQLSQQMSELAESGDWDAVIELESQRRQLLEQTFATKAPIDEALAKGIRRILELDKALVGKSLEIRDEVAAELSQFNRERKAVGAYRSAGR